jgi:hypothetical protein
MKTNNIISNRQSINYAWQLRGSCKTKSKFDKGTGTRIPYSASDFYPETGKSVTDDVKYLCDRCPIKDECLDHALVHEKYGYWGGTTELQREEIRKQKKITFRSPQSNTWMN